MAENCDICLEKRSSVDEGNVDTNDIKNINIDDILYGECTIENFTILVSKYQKLTDDYDNLKEENEDLKRKCKNLKDNIDCYKQYGWN